MKTLIEYMQKENSFAGTVSELIEKLNLEIKNNILSKKLNQYETELKKLGIEFSKKRTGERREILITYKNPMTV